MLPRAASRSFSVFPETGFATLPSATHAEPCMPISSERKRASCTFSFSLSIASPCVMPRRGVRGETTPPEGLSPPPPFRSVPPRGETTGSSR